MTSIVLSQGSPTPYAINLSRNVDHRILGFSYEFRLGDWWDNHRKHFELLVSEAVIAECGAGDPTAVEERDVFLTDLPILEITLECKTLAVEIMKKASLPKKADVDAIHIAVAALSGIDYLLTWNCKHIANPSLRRIIEGVLSDANIQPPVICTPQEMIHVQ